MIQLQEFESVTTDSKQMDKQMDKQTGVLSSYLDLDGTMLINLQHNSLLKTAEKRLTIIRRKYVFKMLEFDHGL